MLNILDIYPFNLAVAIFDSEEEARKIYSPGIHTALSTLTEKEQGIISKRYAENKTLKVCADEYGLTTERIRQIQHKALRKLRHPSRANQFRAVPLDEFKENELKYQKLSREYEALLKAYELLTTKRVNMDEVLALSELSKMLNIETENLKLSHRTYYSLKRTGVRTLGDIVDMSIEELSQIRNLGQKSSDEIMACVKQYGLNLRK